MSLWMPSGPVYEWQLSQTTGRPASAWGTTITSSASANTMGSYTQLIAGASVTEDIAAIRININTNSGATGTNRAMLVTLGIDTAGGTSYTDFISNLSGCGAQSYTVGAGGHWYFFPVRIPGGSSIGAKCQCAVGSITCRVSIQLFACPRNPGTRIGQYVTTLGAQTASSNGTTFTAGTTSEGSWAAIGSALSEPMWYWQLGYGYNGTAQVAAMWHLDLSAGDASNKRLIITDWPVVTTSAEQAEQKGYEAAGCMAEVKNGDIMYVRGQCSGTPAATTGALVYCVGG